MNYQMSTVCHRLTMSWPWFDVAHAEPRAARGFVRIGELVRRRRQRLGLSQCQLELLCDVDQTVISRLENGRLGGLRWSRFARLVDAMGGLGEQDPPPAWASRFLPPGRGAASSGLDHD